jgi:RecA-family ATPase
MQELERLCEGAGAGLLVCDPLAELHNAEENDNTAMRAVIAAFRGLAQRLGIAVLILHHDRKGASTPGDMDRVRGASAISGAVRVMLTLTTCR